MKKETVDTLDKIAYELFNCTACSFHKELQDKDLPYKPEAPLDYDQNSNDYKVLSVGINPGWPNKDKQYYSSLKEIYKLRDFNAYKSACINWWQERKQYGRQPYRDQLYHSFCTINSLLNIYSGPIKREEIYNYVFWSNLSWCNSQNPTKRIFDGNTISCRVSEEETPECLKKEYLKRIIEAIEPELVIFFGFEALRFYYFSKIFGFNWESIDHYPKTQFVAHKRGSKDAYTTIVTAKLKTKKKKTSIIFLPHSCRWEKDNKEKALKEVCGWLKG